MMPRSALAVLFSLCLAASPPTAQTARERPLAAATTPGGAVIGPAVTTGSGRSYSRRGTTITSGSGRTVTIDRARPRNAESGVAPLTAKR
jgi:hypothetical protein